MFRIDSLSLPITYSEKDLRALVAEKLSTSSANVKRVSLIKKSLDARHRSDVHYVLSVAVELISEDGVVGVPYTPPKSSIKDLGLEKKSTKKHVVIVGSGPAGLFAALTLSEYGVPCTILERGDALEERIKKVEDLRKNGILDPESNVQFGEGGAGTFSDGKLGSGISNECFGILYGEFIKYGAPEDIAYESAPHVGTDELRKVLKNIRSGLRKRGVEIRTRARLTDLVIERGKVVGVEVNGEEIIPADYAILAIGHSAEDTFGMLEKRGVEMAPKPFSIGVRAEHEQRLVSEARYGDAARFLPPADYKLSHRLADGRGVYTFCMCPGGEAVCSSDLDGTVVTNGMSNRKRDGRYANAAVLVSVTPDDYDDGVLGGFAFRKRYEKLAYELGGGGYRAPVQRISDFLSDRPSTGDIETSYLPGTTAAELKYALPDYVTAGIKEGLKEFSKKIKGYDRGVLIGVETRSSCPVRILRDDKRQSNVKGLYPAGEGSGYAGGITSSAVDGIKTALAIYEDID